VTGEADIGMGRPVLSAAGIVVVDGPEGGGTFRAVPNLVELRAGPDGWVPHEVPLPEGRSVDRAITVSADGQLLATETWRWPSGREVLLYERRAELELVHREPFAVNEVKLDGGRLWALDPEDVLWWTEPGSTTWEGLPVPTEQGHRLRGDGGRWMAVLGQPVTLLDRERPTLRGTFQSPGHAWFTDGAWVDGQLVLVHETRLFVLDPAASEGLEPVPTPPVRTRTALPPDPIVLPEPETKLEYEYARAVSPPGLGVYKGTYRSAQVLVFERHEVLRLAALQDNRWRTRCPEAVEYPDATLQLPPRDGDPTRSLQDQRLDIRHGAAHAYDLSGLLDVERWDDQRFEGKLDLTVSPASEGGSHGWLRGPVSAEIVDCRP
ncbi:MAG: hypothetical protein KC656_16995, partial [Myxococcales bacterium]|nr:hypothetical protein [Myxococcales bacterium]